MAKVPRGKMRWSSGPAGGSGGQQDALVGGNVRNVVRGQKHRQGSLGGDGYQMEASTREATVKGSCADETEA